MAEGEARGRLFKEKQEELAAMESEFKRVKTEKHIQHKSISRKEGELSLAKETIAEQREAIAGL